MQTDETVGPKGGREATAPPPKPNGPSNTDNTGQRRDSLKEANIPRKKMLGITSGCYLV